MSTPPHILIVGTSPELYCHAARVFRRAGLDSDYADTGQLAIADLRRHTPDVILLGTQLPDMSCVEVCRRIKVALNTAYTRVILACARDEPSEVRVAALAAGADSYVTCPISDQELTAQILAAVRRRRASVTLADVNTMLLQVRDPTMLARRLCSILSCHGVYETAWMALGDAESGLDLVSCTAGADRSKLRDMLAQVPRPPCLMKSLSSEDVWVCERCDTEQSKCCPSWAAPNANAMVAPLVYAGQHYGVLGVTKGADFTATGECEALLSELAGDISLALHGLETTSAAVAVSSELAAQVSQEREFEERLRALVEVSNELALAPSIDHLCRRAVELATQRLGFERMGIWLRDPDNPEALRGTFGIDEQGHLRDEREQRICIEAHVKARVERKSTEPIHLEHEFLRDDRDCVVGTGTWIRAVIWDGDAFAGVISVDNLLSGRDLTSRDGDLLTLYAGTLSNLLFRKQAEISLREREAFYRTIFETTGAAKLVLNADRTIAQVNEEAERFLGYTRAELEAGMDAGSFVAPDQVATAIQNHRARRTGETPVPRRYEVRITARDGDVRDVTVDASLVPGTDKSVVSMMDITDQKRATEQARRRAASQRALSELVLQTTQVTTPGELVSLVLSLTIQDLDVDAGACRYLDQAVLHDLPEQMLNVLNFLQPPDSLDAGPVRVDDCTRPSSPWQEQLCASLVDAGFSSALGISVGHRLSDGLQCGLLVVTRTPRQWTHEESDLLEAIWHQLVAAGERVRLLERGRRQAQSLQLVIDTVPEGVVLLTAEGEVMLANPVARQALAELAAEDEAGRLSRLGDLALDEVLTSSPAVAWHELNSADRVYDALARPLALSDELQGWVLVLRDMTAARRAETELRRQERLATVGQLAAGIAHDFNNIIAVIVLYAQMAERQVSPGARMQEQLRVIREQAHRATDLIQQILDFSRSTPLERRPLELLPYLKEMIKLWERTLPENIEIDFTYERGTTRIAADPTRLQQAFMNVATNARDAMADGGRLEIHVRPFEVGDAGIWSWSGDGDAALSLAAGPWVEVDFTDTGVGIPRELQQRVFEPFFSTKARGKGTGLGLAQIYGIVKQHDGEVTLESEVGSGTTVRILLPAIAETKKHGKSDSTMADIQPGTGELVLVVEDNDATRTVLMEAVAQLGYEVVQANTGAAALAVLDDLGSQVRVVLSDAIMPEMGGTQLLATMVERGHPQPVVMVSGYLAPESRGDVVALPNYVAWLNKPIELAALSDAIRMALDRWQTR